MKFLLAGLSKIGSSRLAGVSAKDLGIKLGLPFALPTMMSLASNAPPEQKRRDILENAALTVATLGMRTGGQIAWSIGWGVARMTGPAVQGIAGGYRTALEQRTMAAIPFSYSSTNMDLAGASLQMARAKMAQAYGGSGSAFAQNPYAAVGNEASFMSARYMSR